LTFLFPPKNKTCCKRGEHVLAGQLDGLLVQVVEQLPEGARFNILFVHINHSYFSPIGVCAAVVAAAVKLEHGLEDGRSNCENKPVGGKDALKKPPFFVYGN
jgi:hypothetical protein